ncbi:hypothetical protein Salat_2773600 [Sesamum alatum]|uniref:CCHC-type domain-containing protein n=1 Tax=Sesamum alatum TaxID=300844 RepID=A0AAE1XLJ0_9LAMI|nr:hypothetical protein Salat_2773600 [Sesamum alatum]
MVDENENPRTVSLDWCDFHVLVHDLPIGKMHKDMAVFLGNQLGKFKDVDLDGPDRYWGSSLRIRVSLDITKPLRRVLKLRTSMGDELLLSLSYKRLPNYCYLCGRLGHLSKSCAMQFVDGFVDPGINVPFGPWLRAPPNLPSRSRVIPPGQHSTSNPVKRPTFISSSSSEPHISYRAPQRGVNIFGYSPPHNT